MDQRTRAAGVQWARWFGGLHRAAAARPARRSVVRAKHHIDREYTAGVALDDLAATARLSKFHFVRAFRAIFEHTPHRYQIERRIRRARELLERTDLSVTAVCFEVGFESLGSFVATFRRHVGEPPRAYRRRFVRAGPVHALAAPACLYRAFSSRPGRAG